MRITNPVLFIRLGGRLRYLSGRVEGNKIIGENYIYDNLQWLRRDLDAIGLRVSLNMFDKKLSGLVDEFAALAEVSELDDESNLLDSWRANALISDILFVEETVFCEAKEQVIASPLPRRFSLEHLLNDPGKILGSGVYDDLSDVAKHDLEYSCRSIAFECPTAAAFHILRCVEECVRILHKAYFPRKQTDKPWGPLVLALSQKPKKPKPEEILVEHLNHLRKRFRNPTDHPEKIYEIEEAEDLVHLSVDVINRVMRDPKVKA